MSFHQKKSFHSNKRTIVQQQIQQSSIKCDCSCASLHRSIHINFRRIPVLFSTHFASKVHGKRETSISDISHSLWWFISSAIKQIKAKLMVKRANNRSEAHLHEHIVDVGAGVPLLAISRTTDADNWVIPYFVRNGHMFSFVGNNLAKLCFESDVTLV